MYSIIQKYTEEGLTSRDDWGSWWDGAFQELVDTHFGNGESVNLENQLTDTHILFHQRNIRFRAAGDKGVCYAIQQFDFLEPVRGQQILWPKPAMDMLQILKRMQMRTSVSTDRKYFVYLSMMLEGTVGKLRCGHYPTWLTIQEDVDMSSSGVAFHKNLACPESVDLLDMCREGHVHMLLVLLTAYRGQFLTDAGNIVREAPRDMQEDVRAHLLSRSLYMRDNVDNPEAGVSAQSMERSAEVLAWFDETMR